MNLTRFLRQYLDKLIQLHREVERQAKEETSIADIWRGLRENFTEKDFSGEAKFTQCGVTLSFKCFVRHEYDEMVERAERA